MINVPGSMAAPFQAPVTPYLLKCLDLSASNRGSSHSQPGALLLREEEAEALGRGIAALNCGSPTGLLSSRRRPPSQQPPRSLEAGGQAQHTALSPACLLLIPTVQGVKCLSTQHGLDMGWEEGVASVRAISHSSPLFLSSYF